MPADVPPAIAAEMAAIADSPEGEQVRVLVARARAKGASADELLTAQLAGIAMNPVAYRRFDKRQSTIFQSTSNLNFPVHDTIVPEVIVGAGFHGAVYATARHLAGYEKPFVLDAGEEVGGAFAVSRNPSFFLNSENTGGLPGSPWVDGANQLNWLPGAPVQCSHITGRELADNTVMRYVIRAALMMHARVITRSKVRTVTGQSYGLKIGLTGLRFVLARRLILATGLGPERGPMPKNDRIMTWSRAMAQMDGNFPFDGMRRVAVLGGGKSGLCACEALLGIGPDTSMRSAAGGMPVKVDLYSTRVPMFRQDWLASMQSRYLRLGSHLATRAEEAGSDGEPADLPDGYDRHSDLYVYREEAAEPIAVPGGALVNGRFYDCAVVCTGHDKGPELAGAEVPFIDFAAAGRVVARKARNLQVYKVGPCADLPWERQDFFNRITVNGEQRVAMHRLAPLTAALAAFLPAP